MDSPPERLLQEIWLHQRVRRGQLRTLDGRTVQVLHPGFQSLEGGPDFRDALLQFGEDAPLSGDIEVDLRSSGWHSHGHDRNPAFQNVILHVIWNPEHGLAGAPPALPLREALDAPLGELSLWLGGESTPGWPEALRGECCAPLRALTGVQVQELLRQSSHVRLESKAAQFQARARQAGWSQALWEGLFRALGYKHNAWPMQRLAELRPRWDEERHSSDKSGAEACLGEVIGMQARLLGIGGLLPDELVGTPGETSDYIRQVWDQWWRERDGFADCILPRGLWRFHGLRPANHPQRRVALGSRWITSGNIEHRLEHWCASDFEDRRLVASLLEALDVGRDSFWSWHFTFKSKRLKQEHPLLGETRVTDLAMNVVLPWLWIRTMEGGNQELRLRLEHRYFHWPAGQDNSVLRQARQRLLGTSSAAALRTASAQQGLLQLLRDFCDHSNAICDQCRLPKLVKEFGAQRPAAITPAPA